MRPMVPAQITSTVSGRRWATSERAWTPLASGSTSAPPAGGALPGRGGGGGGGAARGAAAPRRAPRGRRRRAGAPGGGGGRAPRRARGEPLQLGTADPHRRDADDNLPGLRFRLRGGPDFQLIPIGIDA